MGTAIGTQIIAVQIQLLAIVILLAAIARKL